MGFETNGGFFDDTQIRSQRDEAAIPTDELIEIATLNSTGDPKLAPKIIFPTWMSYKDLPVVKPDQELVIPEHSDEIQLRVSPVRAICHQISRVAARISFPHIGRIRNLPMHPTSDLTDETS